MKIKIAGLLLFFAFSFTVHANDLDAKYKRVLEVQERVIEIKTMDLKKLPKDEKKALKSELKSLKKELRTFKAEDTEGFLDKKLSISVAGLIIIILLLIIIF